MIDHMQEAILALEREIEAIDQHRGSLQRAIDTLRPLVADSGNSKRWQRARNGTERNGTEQGSRQGDARRPP